MMSYYSNSLRIYFYLNVEIKLMWINKHTSRIPKIILKNVCYTYFFLFIIFLFYVIYYFLLFTLFIFLLISNLTWLVIVINNSMSSPRY